MSEGWIKLHRKLTNWCWYKDKNTLGLFVHLLLKANHTDRQWGEKTIKRGRFITSSFRLAEESGLSRQQVRTSLKRLKSTNEITLWTTPKHTEIVINNYDDYQDPNQLSNQQLTNCQPTANQLLTTTKNDNNVKNVKNVKKKHCASASLFDQFWSKYPVKKSKAQASKTWNKIKPDQNLLNTMLSAIEEQKSEKEQLLAAGEFCPQWKNPSTWLNGECWNDEPTEGLSHGRKLSAVERAYAVSKQRREKLMEKIEQERIEQERAAENRSGDGRVLGQDDRRKGICLVKPIR